MKYIIVFLICSISVFSYAQDFRKSNWGDSEKQVRKFEGDVDWYEYETDHQSAITFEGKVGGRDVYIAFLFTDDKLYSGRYIFMDKHSNENDYLDDYNAIESFLVEKYGKKKPDMQWSSRDLEEMFGGRAENYGYQLNRGNLTIINSWETETTEIEHSLEGEDYEIVHRLFYTHKEMSEEVGKKMLEDF